MGVTTRSLYGLRLIVYLMKKGGSATVKEVAEKEGVPYRYMERIVQDMRKANIIASKKGRGGGISLVNPETITLKRLIHSLDGNLIDLPCMPDNEDVCDRLMDCDARIIWMKLLEGIEEFCGKININNLIRR